MGLPPGAGSPGGASPAACWSLPHRSHRSPRSRGRRARGPTVPARHRGASAKERRVFALRGPCGFAAGAGQMGAAPGFKQPEPLSSAAAVAAAVAGGAFHCHFSQPAATGGLHRQRTGDGAAWRGAFLVTDPMPGPTVVQPQALQIRGGLARARCSSLCGQRTAKPIDDNRRHERQRTS